MTAAIIGQDISNEEIKTLSKYGFKERNIDKKIKYLGHKIEQKEISMGKESRDKVANTLRKNMSIGIARCRRNLNLTIIG